MDMTRVPHSEEIDIECFLDRTDAAKIEQVIRETVSSFVADILKARPPSLSLPIRWAPKDDGNGGKAVEDAATIYLHLPLNDGPDSLCIWSVSLLDIVRDSFFWYTEEEGEPFEADDSSRKLVARLREIADMLEQGTLKRQT